uniref:uncharacterized protein n=1 Tax=Myxine glutinosa TaxID=7769 RepID=UPI00358E100F
MESRSPHFANDTCIICHLPEQANDKLRVPTTGLQTIITYGELFNCTDLQKHLQNSRDQQANEDSSSIVVQIHASCQKTISNEIRKKKRSGSTCDVGDVPTSSKVRRRSSTPTVFNWKDHCLFGGESCVHDSRHPDRSIIFAVCQTIEYRGELLERLKCRNDSFAETVRSRLLSCSDLPAAEARYHYACRDKFNIETEQSSSEQQTKRKGRPTDHAQIESFNRLCDWLEAEGELYSVTELYHQMKLFSDSEDAIYSSSQVHYVFSFKIMVD